MLPASRARISAARLGLQKTPEGMVTTQRIAPLDKPGWALIRLDPECHTFPMWPSARTESTTPRPPTLRRAAPACGKLSVER
jgi:hypothetical protein